MSPTPKRLTLDKVADALAGIARTADAELTWSDHSCDMALRQIAAEAHAALDHLQHSTASGINEERHALRGRR